MFLNITILFVTAYKLHLKIKSNNICCFSYGENIPNHWDSLHGVNKSTEI